MIFSTEEIGRSFVLPFVQSDFPVLLLNLFAADLSDEAGIYLIDTWYPDRTQAPLEVRQLLSKLYYQARQDDKALTLLSSVEDETENRIQQMIYADTRDQAIELFQAYVVLDQPLNLQMQRLRRLRRETLMTQFSIHYERDGVTSPSARRLAHQLVLEYPDFPEHWLNYATMVSRQGEGSCAHVLLKLGVHFSRDGEKHLGSYVDGFEQLNDQPENLLIHLKQTLNSHPILSRRAICNQRSLFPRCFEASQILERHETQIDEGSCLRFFK